MSNFSFRALLMLSLTGLIWLFPCLVLAAETTPFGDVLAPFLTQTVFPVLGALVLGFISWAAKKVGDKHKVAALQGNNDLLMQIAAQAVAFAEEKGANFAKSAQPITGNDKLNAAIAYLMQNAPKVTEAQAQSLVTAALAMLPGTGATGQAVVVPAPAGGAVPSQPTADPLAVAP